MKKLIHHECKSCGNLHFRHLEDMTNVSKWVCTRCSNRIILPIERVQLSLPEANGDDDKRKGCIVFEHGGKARSFVDALSKDYKILGRIGNQKKKVKFVLTDNDVLHRAHKLDLAKRRNGVNFFFVYPHAARPNLFNDIYQPYAFTTASFVSARGHAEVMRRFGYEKPIHVIGWSLSEIKPFSKRDSFKDVLFAPIHPRNADIDKRINQAAFSKLSKLAIAGDINLTVRYIVSLQESGLIDLPSHPNINYVQGNMDVDCTESIQLHDVVVGHQTFAWKAVALGVPTLMMGEEENVSHVMTNPIRFVNSWNKYKDILCYPLDILNSNDVIGLVEKACKSDDEIKEWKCSMIGNEFDPKFFVETLESHL